MDHLQNAGAVEFVNSPATVGAEHFDGKLADRISAVSLKLCTLSRRRLEAQVDEVWALLGFSQFAHQYFHLKP